MRNSIKHVLLAAYTNSVTWIRSPRVWFVLLIQCIMCYGGLYELGNSLHQFGWKITPVECFLFIASRQRLLTGTLFLVFISEIPPQCGFHHFQWIRTTRSYWVYGCALYCYLMVLVMLLSLTVVSCLSFAGHLQWSTQWSDSLRVAKGIPESMSIIPAVIRSRFSPVGAYFAFVLLTGSYWLLMALIVMLAAFAKNAQLGLSVTMVIQLLPWIVNTFTTLQESTWFPVYYSDIFMLKYATPGVETFWQCAVAFFMANALLVIMMRLCIRKSPLFADSTYRQ